MKERKKIKRIRIDFLLTEERYNKLMKICGDFKTITEGIAESIDWKYGSLFPDKKNVREQVNTVSIFEDKKLSPEKTLSDEEQAIELERLKEARRLKKLGDTND